MCASRFRSTTLGTPRTSRTVRQNAVYSAGTHMSSCALSLGFLPHRKGLRRGKAWIVDLLVCLLGERRHEEKDLATKVKT